MRLSAGRPAKLALRLYIVPGAPNSLAARSNLAEILAPLGAAEYTVDIVDCLADPGRALADGVIVTPTLVKTSPPEVTIIGSLSDRARVISALGLDSAEARVGDA
jgi:circadian clock protein KaiB